MKKKMTEPKIKVIAFTAQDVIATSGYTGGDPNGGRAKGTTSFSGVSFDI